MNSTRAYAYVYQDMKRAARRGDSMPFAVCLREDDGSERLVGHLNLGNIVRRAFSSAYAGYWVDSRVAGRGRDPDRAGARRRPRVRAGRAAPDRGQHPPGEHAVAAGWWRSWASARRRTTSATCTSTAAGATISDMR